MSDSFVELRRENAFVEFRAKQRELFCLKAKRLLKLLPLVAAVLTLDSYLGDDEIVRVWERLWDGNAEQTFDTGEPADERGVTVTIELLKPETSFSRRQSKRNARLRAGAAGKRLEMAAVVGVNALCADSALASRTNVPRGTDELLGTPYGLLPLQDGANTVAREVDDSSSRTYESTGGGRRLCQYALVAHVTV